MQGVSGVGVLLRGWLAKARRVDWLRYQSVIAAEETDCWVYWGWFDPGLSACSI